VPTGHGGAPRPSAPAARTDLATIGTMRPADPAQLALLVAVLVAAAAVVVRFERLCLQDLAQTPDRDLQLLTRQTWTALIVVLIPIGGLLYLATAKRH